MKKVISLLHIFMRRVLTNLKFDSNGVEIKLEDLKIIFEDIVRGVMDTLEEFTERFQIAGGVRFKEVWFVTLGFFLFSLLARLFKLKAIISWQEGVTSLVIVTGICIFDYLNVNGTKEIKAKFMHGKKEDDVNGK